MPRLHASWLSLFTVLTRINRRVLLSWTNRATAPCDTQQHKDITGSDVTSAICFHQHPDQSVLTDSFKGAVGKISLFFVVVFVFFKHKQVFRPEVHFPKGFSQWLITLLLRLSIKHIFIISSTYLPGTSKEYLHSTQVSPYIVYSQTASNTVHCKKKKKKSLKKWKYLKSGQISLIFLTRKLL